MAEGTFRYDQLLSNMSVAYQNDELIGERLLPVLPVEFKSDKYAIYGPDNLTPQDDSRAPGAEAKIARWATSDSSYYCEGHALKDSVPRESQTDSLPQFDLLADTTMNLTDKVALNQEVAAVAAIDAGLTGTSLAAQTATPWNNDDNDPVALIKAQGLLIAQRTGKRPNKFFVCADAWSAITLNNNVRALISGAPNLAAAAISPAQFAALIDVDEVVVARATKNTAHQGQTASMSWVWAQRAVLAVVPQAPGRRMMALGYHFVWRRALAALAGGTVQGAGNGFQFVERYYWQPLKADVVEVHKYYDPRIVAAGAGCLFSNCLGG